MLGLPPIDAILADAPPGTRVALVCRPGAQGEALLTQASRLSKASAYLTLVRPPSAIRKKLDPSKAIIIDGFSGLLGSRDEASIPIADADEPLSLRAALQFIHEHQPKAGLIIEGLNGVVERRDDLEAAAELIQDARQFPWSLVHMVDWGTENSEQVLQDCEAVIEIGVVEDRIVTSHHVKLRHASWTDKRFGPAVIRVRNDEVLIEVPKIIITGPESAGKTTFIRNSSDRSAHAEHGETTVGGEHGTVESQGLRALLWGVPGQKRFDPLWPTLSKNAIAGVLLIASDEPESFDEAKRHWQRLRAMGIPLIVVANKQDAKGALDAAAIRDALDIPPEVLVMGCSALDAEGAQRAMRRLIHNVLHGGDVE